MSERKDIESISFGILSPKEIVNMSVCRVDNTKLTGPCSVYDERMGINMDKNIPCPSCNLLPKFCPGHFGHIELNECIIHPLFYKYVVSFLKCFCIKCNKLLITKDHLLLCGIMKYKNERRFKKILEKLEKIDTCSHDDCNHPQPKIIHTITDNTISMVNKEKYLSEEELKAENIIKKDKTISIVLTVDEIKKIFDMISDEDIVLCGLDPTRIHPRNLILSVFPVIPPCSRPYIVSDGNICDDDLTNQLLEIIKANNVIKASDADVSDEKKDNKKQKALQSLKFRISTFYNNSQCLAPETPVLMWDGKIKRADEIKIGSILVGDDLKKRHVLSTCRGIDKMYEIVQDNAENYIVNSNHILTLKSIKSNELVDIHIQKYLQLSQDEKSILRGIKHDKNSDRDILSEINIQEKGIGRYVGFSIDGNQRFLLGDCTITHNSKAKHPTNGEILP
jgi:hypothetical protein